MFGGSRGDMVLQIISRRRCFPHTHEKYSKHLGGDEDEERKIPCYGNFEGKV